MEDQQLTATEGAIKLLWNYFDEMHKKHGIVYLEWKGAIEKWTPKNLYPYQQLPAEISDRTKRPPDHWRVMNRKERRAGYANNSLPVKGFRTRR